jgi:hypothetical protein
VAIYSVAEKIATEIIATKSGLHFIKIKIESCAKDKKKRTCKGATWNFPTGPCRFFGNSPEPVEHV